MTGHHQVTAQGLRFIAVGIYNVAFTLAAFWILDHLWGEKIGVQAVYWTSAVAGVINGFIAQRMLVWKSKGAWRGELLKFVIMNASVSVVNSLLLLLTVTVWGLPAFPSQVAITAVLTACTFFIGRSWVFRAGRIAAKEPERDE